MFKSIFEAIKSVFELLKTNKEHIISNEVIDDKNKLEKACYYAEKAISKAETSAYFDDYRSKRKFDLLVENFRKYK